MYILKNKRFKETCFYLDTITKIKGQKKWQINFHCYIDETYLSGFYYEENKRIVNYLNYFTKIGAPEIDINIDFLIRNLEEVSIRE